jgi:hypothetical protein
VVPPRRSGGQERYLDRSLPEEIGADPLSEVVAWALEHLHEQFDVETLAARAYMSAPSTAAFHPVAAVLGGVVASAVADPVALGEGAVEEDEVRFVLAQRLQQAGCAVGEQAGDGGPFCCPL